MKASERLLLILTMLLLIALCIGGALVVCGIVPLSDLAPLIGSLWGQVLLVLAAVCVCLLAVRCMWIGLGDSSSKPMQTATLSVSPSGDVRIAQEAIADFCVQTARHVEGVQSAACKLMQKEVGVTVSMTLLAGIESNLVDLAANVQARIKEMLEASCGITDASVEVLFEKKA